MAIGSRLKHAWNAFVDQSREGLRSYGDAVSYGSRPDRVRFSIPNERSIISSIFTRLSVDVAAVEIRHVRTDDSGRYSEDMDSGLNNCLTLEANLDQAAQAFRLDIALTLCEEGVAAIVPVDTSISPSTSGGFDILSLRVGSIVQWMPQHVKVRLYNEKIGRREEIVLEKKFVAIVENPLYSVMNEPNSTLQRLIRKLNILDAIDDASGSGKLDIIIQLPYAIKSDSRRQQAEQRRTDIEFQLKGSKYGIAYADATEKITQLNRPAENNLLAQIEFLTDMLYGQLGLTAEVMNGTADEKTMRNYRARTIKPIMTAITEAMKRSFLTKTARTQKQSIMYFLNQFDLVSLTDLADIADVFARNEIATSNEIRQVVGWKPHDDPKADKLQNSNMPQPGDSTTPGSSTNDAVQPKDSTAVMAESFDQISAAIDTAFQGLE